MRVKITMCKQILSGLYYWNRVVKPTEKFEWQDLAFSPSHPSGMPRPPRGAREAPDPPPRRNAFTKISEPAKIAVSCLTVPQGLCAVFNPGQKAPISYQTPLTSHAFAEVMFTPQITETVVYQCAEHHIQQQVRSLTQTFHTTTFPKFEIFSN